MREIIFVVAVIKCGHKLVVKCFLVRPEVIAFGADLFFTADVFFISTRDLRDASADRCEILHGRQ